MLPAACNEGTWVPGEFKSTLDCITCEPGYECAGGRSQPRHCFPGSVAPFVNSSECTMCEGGSYQGEAGRTACTACTRGSHCPLGASAPLPCLKGTYSDATNLTHSDECLACPAGHVCGTASIRPQKCSAGSYQAARGGWQCPSCEAGTYQDASGATACRACVRGSFCPAGASAPRACREGTYMAIARI